MATHAKQQCLVYDVKKYAIHDGAGIRTTVFLKGCPLSCQWCHNPESISPEQYVLYNHRRCIGCRQCLEACSQNAVQYTSDGIELDRSLCRLCGDCVNTCPGCALEMVGRYATVADVMAGIKKDILFYDSSNGGVTFSGGEPLLQWRPLLDLLTECVRLEIHTAVDTSGFARWDILEKVAAQTDLFLYDLKLMDDSRHRFYTGVSNQLILSNLEQLTRIDHNVMIRIPLIPGVNDDTRNLQRMGSFLAALKNIQQVEILPYHNLHLSKSQKFKIPVSDNTFLLPTQEQLLAAVNILRHYGLNVRQS